MDGWMLLACLGLFAGALTTLAGLGGGLLLLLALTLLSSPAHALAVTAPALLIGNLHRLAMLRRELDRHKALAFAMGALPAAAIGGAAAMLAPGAVLQAVIVSMTVFALVRRALRLPWRVPTRWLTPAGAAIGALTGAGGGAGVLTAPLLLAAELRGEAYVATAAACAMSMHAGRLVGYGAMGAVDGAMLAQALGLSLAIALGNHLGRRLRPLTERLPEGALEHGVLALCVTLSLVMMS